MRASCFGTVEAAPPDPIFGLTEAFKQDNNPNRQNLGAGVYQDDSGKTPLLSAVVKARELLAEYLEEAAYLPISGDPNYLSAAHRLLFGENSPIFKDELVCGVQTLGGTGALRVGADFLKAHFNPPAVYMSDPTWVNHNGIFTAAGYKIEKYPYYRFDNHKLDFEAMQAGLRKCPKASVVLLHTTCHNPTGEDISTEGWQALVEIFKEKELIPFFDCAYQGFAKGVEEDVKGLHIFAEAGMSFLVAQSFSKSFSLYRRRVGTLAAVCNSSEEAKKVFSQLKIVVRRSYSNPPVEGAAYVMKILETPELKNLWLSELGEMRNRLSKMRALLVDKLVKNGAEGDFSFLTTQNGMFSFLGLTKARVEMLKSQFSIYTVDSSRISVGSLNTGNIDYIAEAIAKVTRSS